MELWFSIPTCSLGIVILLVGRSWSRPGDVYDPAHSPEGRLVPPGESPAGGRVEGGTRPIGGSRLGGESTSEARREGLVPLQTRLVPSGRREATDAGNRWPNFCRTVLGGVAFSLSRPAGEGRGEGCG